MSYRQEIHGQQEIPVIDERGLATPDELMQKAERNKRLELVCYKILQSARLKGVHLTQAELRNLGLKYLADQDVWAGLQRAANIPPHERQPEPQYSPPDPVYTEEEKVQRAREAWEYNKMTQDLQGEIPPGWTVSTDPKDPIRPDPMAPSMRFWERVKIGAPGTTEAAVEDEALRRRVYDLLDDVDSLIEYDPEGKMVTLKEELNELMGRYEALFALAETYAKASPVDANGVYVSRRPQENIPGKDHM